MRIVSLPRRDITAFASTGVSMAFLPALAATDGARVHVANLTAGATIGRHPAPRHQVFAVVQGRCRVTCDDDAPRHVHAGQAVIWSPGEDHQTWAETDVVAVVVETSGDLTLDEHFPDVPASS